MANIHGPFTNWDASNAGWSLATARYVIPASTITASATAVKIKMGYLDTDWSFFKCRIQQRAAVGDPYDYSDTPYSVNFAGGPGGTVSIEGLLSDEIIGLTIDETKDYIVAIYVPVAGASIPYRSDSTGYELYYILGDDIDTVDATGYGTSALNGKRHMVELISGNIAPVGVTKLNGVSVSSIGKFNGIEWTEILKYNGVA
jgi:hypothetical protein